MGARKAQKRSRQVRGLRWRRHQGRLSWRFGEWYRSCSRTKRARRRKEPSVPDRANHESAALPDCRKPLISLKYGIYAPLTAELFWRDPPLDPIGRQCALILGTGYGNRVENQPPTPRLTVTGHDLINAPEARQRQTVLSIATAIGSHEARSQDNPTKPVTSARFRAVGHASSALLPEHAGCGRHAGPRGHSNPATAAAIPAPRNSR